MPQLRHPALRISKPFFIGTREVTQAEWRRVMGYNNSFFKGDERPGEMISWNEAMLFIEKLNEKEGAKAYRLPTEAEWEFAARAGTETFFWHGEHPRLLPDYAWIESNAGGMTRPARQKDRSQWGLYDVYGNLGEWTADWYGEDYYKKSPGEDPRGPESGGAKAIRGCSWIDPPKKCRSAYRNFLAPRDWNAYTGLRVAKDAAR